MIRRHLHGDTYVPVLVDVVTNEIMRDPKSGLAVRRGFSDGGEILVRCASKAEFSGYRNNQIATGKKFVTDVLCKGDLFYRTGDALRRTPDGLWYFMDRYFYLLPRASRCS